MWRHVGGSAVIKLISLGHAKLAQRIEKRERRFLESAQVGALGDGQAAVQGGAMRTKLSQTEIGKKKDFLAPEYKNQDTVEDHYVMDWFSGLNPGLALQLSMCCDATVTYVTSCHSPPPPRNSRDGRSYCAYTSGTMHH